jgi:hypothetical protein
MMELLLDSHDRAWRRTIDGSAAAVHGSTILSAPSACCMAGIQRHHLCRAAAAAFEQSSRRGEFIEPLYRAERNVLKRPSARCRARFSAAGRGSAMTIRRRCTWRKRIKHMHHDLLTAAENLLKDLVMFAPVC